MAFTVEQAKAMRAAYQRAGNRVVQIGHQILLARAMSADAPNYLASGSCRPRHRHPRPHVSQYAARQAAVDAPVYPDMTPETIDWNAFLGSAPARDFDADRYVNWRLF